MQGKNSAKTQLAFFFTLLVLFKRNTLTSVSNKITQKTSLKHQGGFIPAAFSPLNPRFNLFIDTYNRYANSCQNSDILGSQTIELQTSRRAYVQRA